MSEKFIDPRSRTRDGTSDRLFRSESARDLFTTLYKRRALYWTILIVVAASFYALATRIPETYTASSRVRFNARLEQEYTQDADNPERFRYRMMTAPDVAAEIQLFQAKEVRDRVASDPEILADPPLKNMPKWSQRSEEERYRAWMNYLYDNFSAEGITNTNLVVLRFDDWQPDRAAKLANMLGEAYVAHRSQPPEEKQVELERLRQAVANSRAIFEEVSGALDAFRTEHGISSNTVADEAARLQEAKATIDVRLAEARSLLAGVESRLASVSGIEPSQLNLIKALPEVDNNNQIKSIEEEIRLFRARYKREDSVSFPTDPTHRLVKEQLDDAIARHREEVQNAFEGLVYQLQTAAKEKRAEVESYETALATAQAEIDRLAQLNTELDQHLVEYEAKRESYQLAQKRLSTAESSGADLPEVLVSLAGRAAPPQRPSMPPPTIVIALLAFALGLFLAVTAVFVAGYLDRTLDTPGEAERELGLPVLATIQNERGFKRKRRRRR